MRLDKNIHQSPGTRYVISYSTNKLEQTNTQADVNTMKRTDGMVLQRSPQFTARSFLLQTQSPLCEGFACSSCACAGLQITKSEL